MKKPIVPLQLLAVVFTVIASPGSGVSAAPEHSDLWGESGALWNPATSRLRNFTNAGYMSGSVPIPDWAVGVNVTTFGAIPNDGIDDSPAFSAAIAACPDFHAVFVPNGRYTLLQQIVPNRNNFVLRGEDMYQTVLHCPKYLNEIYIQEVGYLNPAYDDGSNGPRHTGAPKGFFRVTGGTHRSIENLSFEFREQRKMGHWEHKGADAIHYGDNVVDSWVRNIRIKNSDHGVMVDKAQRVSFLNIVFDHSIGRPDIIGAGGTHRFVGHIGMSMSGALYCLYHNIDLRGDYSHDFDIINVPKNCVVSNITGTDVSLHHHGGGANLNLYTNASVGTGPGIGSLVGTQNNETHWRIFGNETLEAPTAPANLSNNHVFVGYDSTQTEIIDATTWYEVIDPALLEPQNIYLAQLAHPLINKPLPQGPPPPLPSPFTGDVIRINPIEDSHTKASTPGTVQDPATKSLPVGENMYFKFDLNGLSLSTIAKVRFRVSSKNFSNTPVALAVSSINDDSWSDDTLTYTGRPTAVAQLHVIAINENSTAQVLEFDVTPFVQAQWAADKVVSLVIERVSGSGALSSIRSSEIGLAPELVIEQVASSVPGAPSAPAAVKSFSLIGNVQLDWANNPESDVATYNVYRSTVSSGFNQYAEPIASGLLTSDFVDMQSSHHVGWDVGMMRDDVAYYYRVTAVDKHGYESASSLEIVGTAKGYANSNQPPVFNAGPLVLPNANQYASYTGTLAGWATDPESDPLYFSKVDGPAWLTIAHDGTLSGTPLLGDTGTYQFTVQVNSLGSGRDEATVQITVNPASPGAPVGMTIVPGDASEQLDWSHASEGSAYYTFKVYRSTSAGGPYTGIASGLTVSNYTDSGLTNGTTYYYVVTASNPSGESPPGVEVSATPVAGLAIMTNFLGGALSVSGNWDAGLPVGKWGRINVNATTDTLDTLNGWSVLHTGGTLPQSGLNALRLDGGTTWITEGPGATSSTSFRGFIVAGGSSFTLRKGTINTVSGRDWTVTGAGSKITVHGGTINLGRSLLLASSGSFTINAGVINGNPSSGDMGVGNIFSGGTLNFNGGTTTINRIDLRGTNSTFNFGGSATGSLTATAFVGTFGANSVINFQPGSRMSLRVSGEDEWAAAKWAAADLTYNGQGVASLGAWAVVTAPNGLGPGVRFDYDSVTETLRIVVRDSDGDGIEDAWEVLHFGSTEAIDGSLDSDGDAVLDFFEYLRGSNPEDPASRGFQITAKADTDGSGTVFTWEVLQGFSLETDYEAWLSTNLGNWNRLSVGDYQIDEDTQGGVKKVELRLTTEPQPDAFLRLQQP